MGKFLYYANVAGLALNTVFFLALHTWYNLIAGVMNVLVVIFCTNLLED